VIEDVTEMATGTRIVYGLSLYKRV